MESFETLKPFDVFLLLYRYVCKLIDFHLDILFHRLGHRYSFYALLLYEQSMFSNELTTRAKAVGKHP